MVDSFNIRRASAADAAAMPAIEQSAGELFATLPDLAWLATGENRSVALYQDLIEGGWFWIAEDEAGEPCGFLAAQQIGDLLHIHEYGVARDTQRKGIGTALMHTAMGAAIRYRLSALTLITFADVAWNGPAYERMGFRRIADADLPPELRTILTDEARAGLPIDRRCAMRLELPEMDEDPPALRDQPTGL